MHSHQGTPCHTVASLSPPFFALHWRSPLYPLTASPQDALRTANRSQGEWPTAFLRLPPRFHNAASCSFLCISFADGSCCGHCLSLPFVILSPPFTAVLLLRSKAGARGVAACLFVMGLVRRHLRHLPCSPSPALARHHRQLPRTATASCVALPAPAPCPPSNERCRDPALHRVSLPFTVPPPRSTRATVPAFAQFQGPFVPAQSVMKRSWVPPGPE